MIVGRPLPGIQELVVHKSAFAACLEPDMDDSSRKLGNLQDPHLHC